MNLQNKVVKDFKVFSSSVNALVSFHKKHMSDAVREFQSNVIKIVAFHLSSMGEINYRVYSAMRMNERISQEIIAQLKVTAHRMFPHYDDLKSSIDILSRLFPAFIARKAQPPWIPVKLDLTKKFNRKDVPDHESIIEYYLNMMANNLMGQIQLGVKNEESLTDILKRIRSQFQEPRKRAHEADRRPKYLKDDNSTNDEYDPESWTLSTQAFGKPPVQVDEGVYTLEDVTQLQADQKAAMDWYYRDYSPDMDEAVWERNKAMMGLERDMMNDMLYALHNGFIDVGSENMGIKDFVWVTSKPQKECDVCCERDGMTMKEIEEKYGKGAFDKNEAWPETLRQNSPPPLHPHCRCQLVAKLKDDWADEALQKQGFEWDPETGDTFNPTQAQKKLGFTKMSWDQWLGDLGGK